MSGAWKRVLGDCFVGEELAEWKAAKERLGPSFDHEAYAAAWVDYNARMQDALPLEAGTEKTKALIAEWDALCATYMTVVDDKVKNGPKPLWAFPMLLDDPEVFKPR